MEQGNYTNPIFYLAVAKSDARIKMSLSSLHIREQFDYTLETILRINKD